MPIITPAIITDKGWEITIRDLQVTGRNQFNPNKLNLNRFNTCRFAGCANSINIRRESGLCDIHLKHEHDLFLEIKNPVHKKVSAPKHTEIVDRLIEWAQTRNYDLIPFFSAMSFNVLGNIPDVSTLACDTIHIGFTPPLLQDLFDKIINIV